MPPDLPPYEYAPDRGPHSVNEQDIETDFIERLRALILQRMLFNGEQLTELMEPLGLNWKARRVKELALMAELVPLLKKRAAGRDISGLSAYEQ
jgi:type I restriction enzyme R subunit